MTQPTKQFVAAKAIILNNQGQVLLQKQNDPRSSGHDMLHPPGGILELGESLKECVAREVLEEIGVPCVVHELFDVGEWTPTIRGDTYQAVGLYFACSIESHDFTLQDEEVSEVVWVSLAEIESSNILEPSKSILKRYLENATG